MNRAVINMGHVLNRVGPITEGNVGVMKHGGDAHLHCAEKTFYCAVLVVGVGGRKALDDFEAFASFLKIAISKHFFGVCLDYLDFRVAPGEQVHFVAVALN